jgi:hypothetical protein
MDTYMYGALRPLVGGLGLPILASLIPKVTNSRGLTSEDLSSSTRRRPMVSNYSIRHHLPRASSSGHLDKMEYYAATAPLDLIFGSSSNATQTQMPSARRPSPSTGTTSPSTGRRPPSTPLQHEEDDYPPTSVLITAVRLMWVVSRQFRGERQRSVAPLPGAVDTRASDHLTAHC